MEKYSDVFRSVLRNAIQCNISPYQLATALKVPVTVVGEWISGNAYPEKKVRAQVYKLITESLYSMANASLVKRQRILNTFAGESSSTDSEEDNTASESEPYIVGEQYYVQGFTPGLAYDHNRHTILQQEQPLMFGSVVKCVGKLAGLYVFYNMEDGKYTAAVALKPLHNGTSAKVGGWA